MNIENDDFPEFDQLCGYPQIFFLQNPSRNRGIGPEGGGYRYPFLKFAPPPSPYMHALLDIHGCLLFRSYKHADKFENFCNSIFVETRIFTIAVNPAGNS